MCSTNWLSGTRRSFATRSDMTDYIISGRRKANKIVVARERAEFQRGFIYNGDEAIPAIRFRSGIVHEFKSRRGVRVSRRLAQTFVPNEE